MSTIIYSLILNFIFGGFTIATISYVGTFLDPLMGAIWWSFPISLLPTIYFMRIHGKTNNYIAKFVLGISASLILLIISTFVFSYFLKTTSNNIIQPIIYTMLIWCISSAIFIALLKFFNLDKLFLK